MEGDSWGEWELDTVDTNDDESGIYRPIYGFLEWIMAYIHNTECLTIEAFGD